MRDTKQSPNQLPRPHQLQWARPHPSGASPPSRWPADASVPTWPQSVSRSRCTGVYAAAAQKFPGQLGAPGNRRLLSGPHRPAPAHLGAGSSAPSPGCRGPRAVWPHPPGVATSPGDQDWCLVRNLILCVLGPRAPPCLFVTQRPCHRPRERCLRGPRPAGV